MALKTVVISGSLDGMPEPPAGAEIWSVNRGFQHTPGLDRLFCFHDLNVLAPTPPRRAETLAALKKVRRVVMCQSHPEIPNSEPYPLADVVRAFGVPYFTCSLAYMLALAVMEGFERIIVWRVQVLAQSVEYVEQKPCLDFWLGVALGRGVKVELSEDSLLTRPQPWQPPLYGYCTPMGADVVGQVLASAVQLTVNVEVPPCMTDPAAGKLLAEPGAVERLPVDPRRRLDPKMLFRAPKVTP